MSFPINKETEWLETDGLGGFAMGSTNGVRTRRYHSMLISAATPPTGRFAARKHQNLLLGEPGGDQK